MSLSLNELTVCLLTVVEPPQNSKNQHAVTSPSLASAVRAPGPLSCWGPGCPPLQFFISPAAFMNSTDRIFTCDIEKDYEAEEAAGRGWPGGFRDDDGVDQDPPPPASGLRSDFGYGPHTFNLGPGLGPYTSSYGLDTSSSWSTGADLHAGGPQHDDGRWSSCMGARCGQRISPLRRPGSRNARE